MQAFRRDVPVFNVGIEDFASAYVAFGFLMGVSLDTLVWADRPSSRTQWTAPAPL